MDSGTKYIKVGVWGAGREGLSVAHHLRHVADSVVVIDEAEASRPAQLDEDIEYASGAGSLSILDLCEFVVASPGVPRMHAYRQHLADVGIPVSSPTDLWMTANWQRTIGVTGTKGKSTTSSLINELLRASGVDSVLAGNMGMPLMDVSSADSVVVAELSSYQCAFLSRSPRIAVITNLYQDHLTWHGGLDRYWIDKANIFSGGSDVLVCNRRTLSVLQRIATPLPDRVVLVDDFAFSPAFLRSLPGVLAMPHNIENLRAAVCATNVFLGRQVGEIVLAEATADFVGLPHRLELVSTVGERTWVDDTLSTTTESVVAAVDSFEGRDVVLIVGGLERGVDYGLLNERLLDRLPRVQVLCLPANGERIIKDYRRAFPNLVRPVKDMQDAVRTAWELSAPNSVVLLSPGAPSQDVYRDFEEKALDFRSEVGRLAS